MPRFPDMIHPVVSAEGIKETMRKVGHRDEVGNAMADQGAMARTAAALRGTPFLVPRGVYRFRTFDEADAWMIEMMRRTHAHLSRKTSPGSVDR